MSHEAMRKLEMHMTWEIDGETVRDFTFSGSKITADGDWQP